MIIILIILSFISACLVSLLKNPTHSLISLFLTLVFLFLLYLKMSIYMSFLHIILIILSFISACLVSLLKNPTHSLISLFLTLVFLFLLYLHLIY